MTRSQELLTLNSHGGIAQLAEHLHGMQGVMGSNPITSTNSQIPNWLKMDTEIRG